MWPDLTPYPLPPAALMQLQITAIKIDWQDEFDWIQPISTDERARITAGIVGSVWNVDDCGDLIAAITSETGWSIHSVTCRPPAGPLIHLY